MSSTASQMNNETPTTGYNLHLDRNAITVRVNDTCYGCVALTINAGFATTTLFLKRAQFISLCDQLRAFPQVILDSPETFDIAFTIPAK